LVLGRSGKTVAGPTGADSEIFDHRSPLLSLIRTINPEFIDLAQSRNVVIHGDFPGSELI
jgi:hypothetical protein